MTSTAPGRARYHHGDLRNALVEAATGLARIGGPQAVVLREVARRAGVTHNAAYRHFADRQELVDEVGVRAMGELASAMALAIGPLDDDVDPTAAAEARLRAGGRGYVRFALAEPGLFRTAFASAAGQPPGPAVPVTPWTLLTGVLDDAAAAGVVAPERRAGAEITAWSAVHGLAVLLLDGPLTQLPDPARTAALEELLTTVVHGFRGP